MRHWEGGEGEDIGQGIRQYLGRLGEVFLQLGDHPVGLGMDLFRRELLAHGAHHGGDAGLGPVGHPGEQVGRKVGAARCQPAPANIVAIPFFKP